MLLQDTSANFGDRLQQSFTQVFGDIVPALLGALVILFAGYLLAKVLEKLVERFLRRIRLNRMLERGGVMQAVERSGSHLNPIRVLANLVFWLVMFAVILVAANALGLQSLANVFSELVSYIPSVIAAIVIILVGIVLGGFVGGLISAFFVGAYTGTLLTATNQPVWAQSTWLSPLFLASAASTGVAAMILLIFMHVWYSTRLTWVVALGSLLWLAILIAYTVTDYMTRHWLHVPGH